MTVAWFKALPWQLPERTVQIKTYSNREHPKYQLETLAPELTDYVTEIVISVKKKQD